jgi:hypothetical protein
MTISAPGDPSEPGSGDLVMGSGALPRGVLGSRAGILTLVTVAGLALGFGVLTAIAVGLAPARSRRVLILVAGVVIGL